MVRQGTEVGRRGRRVGKAQGVGGPRLSSWGWAGKHLAWTRGEGWVEDVGGVVASSTHPARRDG